VLGAVLHRLTAAAAAASVQFAVVRWTGVRSAAVVVARLGTPRVEVPIVAVAVTRAGAQRIEVPIAAAV
jgi:hypothetical protein